MHPEHLVGFIWASAFAGETGFGARTAAAHRIRLWRVDPGVVFERLIISRGDLPESYLGPVEGVRR